MTDGQQAATRVRPLARGDDYSLLQLRLLTGRTHQIRVHLAHAGHPILGDDKYGNFELNRALAKRGVRRLLLHAWRLALRHPTGGERLQLQAPLPSGMLELVEEWFPGHGGSG